MSKRDELLEAMAGFVAFTVRLWGKLPDGFELRCRPRPEYSQVELEILAKKGERYYSSVSSISVYDAFKISASSLMALALHYAEDSCQKVKALMGEKHGEGSVGRGVEALPRDGVSPVGD